MSRIGVRHDTLQESASHYETTQAQVLRELRERWVGTSTQGDNLRIKQGPSDR